jgi:SAM-dependent methyltransferase
MNLIEYKSKKYPKYLIEGFASQFIIPFAKKFCKGVGYDIGCMKKEWSFPNSIPIDKNFDDGYDAMHLPIDKKVDYVFSSHCLEHTDNWVYILDYWTSVLKKGGILFLYLPHYDHIYWRPWNNRKHIHILTSQILKDYMIDKGYINIFHSERDLNDSFAIVGEKGGN